MLDVEGAEIPALMKLVPEFLQRIPQITVEFHDFLNEGERAQISRVRKRLLQFGFRAFRFSWHDWSDVLFVNSAGAVLTGLDVVRVTFGYKYLRGLWRIVRRRRGP